MTRSQPLTLVLAATSPALGIGKNGGLPWRLKREMKYFRQVTDRGVVVMGRRTWESIPPRFRPLANRVNIVVSSDARATYGDGVLAASSLDDALRQAAAHDAPLFVIGGAQLYRASLPRAERVLLTLIDDPDAAIECDTHFSFGSDAWQQQPTARLREAVGAAVDLPDDACVSENGLSYKFTLWERAAPPEGSQ